MEDRVSRRRALTKYNLEAYQLIFEIESVLRELLIEHIERSIGPKWDSEVLTPSACNRLADALREGAERRRKDDRKTWTSRRVFHPLYFIELSDLAHTFQMKKNASLDALVVASERDAVSEQLLRILPVRNAVAHMRLITQSDLLQIRTAHSLLASSVGRDTFERLAEQLPSQTMVTREMEEMAQCLSSAAEAVGKFEAINLAAWKRLSSRWWLDEKWHVDAKSIRAAAELCEKYEIEFGQDVLMRRVRMQRWVEQCWNPQVIMLAQASLKREVSDD